MPEKQMPLNNREISWLYFNGRVLQEAADVTVPLLERLRFLGIFSSNLDEFYRVRVATLSRLSGLNEKSKKILGYDPENLLVEIKELVVKQEQKFDSLYQQLIRELAEEKIFLLDETQLNVERGTFVKKYFREQLLSSLVPVMIEGRPLPELRDHAIYFFVKLQKNKKAKLALMELPDTMPRFLVLPETNGMKYIILLDDVVRYNLDDIFFTFEYDKIEAYSIQVTRDAELDLDRGISERFIDALAKSLQKRKKGKPMRLQYDANMPAGMLTWLAEKLNLSTNRLIAGNRYQNFKDFINFPDIGRSDLLYKIPDALPVNGLLLNKSLISQISARDYLISTPYQSFEHVLYFLREAAIDPKVFEINITLYRLAEHSKVIHALISAAKNGKNVNCVIELRARFDEQNNIAWSNLLQQAGINVIYGLPQYKVHCKMCLVIRKENGKNVKYACLSTGNFNEVTSQAYADYILLTASKKITHDIHNVFKALGSAKLPAPQKHIMVSPVNTRAKIYQLIDNEIANAQHGKPAYMILKMNSLADEDMIKKLYKASQAGVEIKLIIRGMCCLQPGIKNISDNISVISIVDKYLEHARVHIFCNGGDELLYLTSADFMTRNLDNRIEVGFPVYNEQLKNEIKEMIHIQLKDNTKAREIDANNSNNYYKAVSGPAVRAQIAIYNYLKTIEH